MEKTANSRYLCRTCGGLIVNPEIGSICQDCLDLALKEMLKQQRVNNMVTAVLIMALFMGIFGGTYWIATGGLFG